MKQHFHCMKVKFCIKIHLVVRVSLLLKTFIYIHRRNKILTTFSHMKVATKFIIITEVSLFLNIASGNGVSWMYSFHSGNTSRAETNVIPPSPSKHIRRPAYVNIIWKTQIKRTNKQTRTIPLFSGRLCMKGWP